MKLIRLTQSTPAWLDWRRTGITASDVSCLFGTNPYKTEWKLWAEKSGLQAEDDLSGNPYVRRGKVFEHMLREHVVDERNIGIMPVCVEHDGFPYLKASLDGIDRHKRPWEFKIPSPNNFEEVCAHRINSEPAQRYLLQVQHQTLVTGAREGYLIFGNIDDSGSTPRVVKYILLTIPADPSLHRTIIEKSKEFMRRLKERDAPAKDPDRDLFAPQNPQDAARWQTASQKLIPLLQQKAELERKLEHLKEGIKAESRPIVDVLGNNKFGEFSGLRATRVDRKANVDWIAYLKDNGHDTTDENKVGPYRKAGSGHYYKFTAL